MKSKPFLKIFNSAMNLFIVIILVQGVFQIGQKTIMLVQKSEDIDIVRESSPWYSPLNNVTVLFKTDMIKSQPLAAQQISFALFGFSLLNTVIFMPLFISILWYLNRLIHSIFQQTFFHLKNIRIIKILSMLTAGWVLARFIFYQALPWFLPDDFIDQSINYFKISESVWINIISAIDFKMLLVAIFLFITSVAFREGYQMKEDADLTI